MTGEKIIRAIVLQSKDQPHGRDGGWIEILIPGVSERDISLHIKGARDRGLIKAWT
jgi:hypothetical protein